MENFVVKLWKWLRRGRNQFAVGLIVRWSMRRRAVRQCDRRRIETGTAAGHIPIRLDLANAAGMEWYLVLQYGSCRVLAQTESNFERSNHDMTACFYSPPLVAVYTLRTSWKEIYHSSYCMNVPVFAETFFWWCEHLPVVNLAARWFLECGSWFYHYFTGAFGLCCAGDIWLCGVWLPFAGLSLTPGVVVGGGWHCRR